MKSREELEMSAIEAGAQDVVWRNDILEIYTKPEELEKTRKGLEEKGIKSEDSSLEWVPKEEIDAEKRAKESCQKLFGALDELESVQNIYSNLKI